MEIEEVWVTIDGLERYAVSNFGRVINQERGNELNPSPDANGYLRVGLSRKGVTHNVYVHRLVARAFFLNYKPGVEVKHISDIKTDNSVLNLTLGGGCRKGKDANNRL
jgi:hypothetical protein